MKLPRRWLSLIICAVLLVPAIPAAASADSGFPAVLAEAKKAVVQIYCLGEDGQQRSSWIGTGFAVGELGNDSDIFLTNWHVATDNGNYSPNHVQIWILQENCELNEQTFEPDPYNSITCEVLKTTSGFPDYAILRATEPIEGYKPLALLSSENVPDGQTVYSLGYPGVVNRISANHYGMDDITATDGIISKHMLDKNNVQVLMHTAQISGGNSGGPLITENGAVVGLNTYGFGDTQGNMNRYCAEYIDYAMEGLDELGLPYELYGQQENTAAEEPEEKTEPFLLIATGIMLIAVLLLVSQKRGKQQADKQTTTAASPSSPGVPPQQPEKPAPQPPQKARVYLQLNNGPVFPVPASGCMIGRASDCTITLPANAPGVSKHHCKLIFQEDQLRLTDLNSSYGTYIHSSRIPSGVPVVLKHGSSFCLGSEAYRFTVQ